MELNRKSLFLAQLIKEAGQINSETKLAKMLCYVEKERGIKTGFTFDKNHKHGNYSFEVKEEINNLVKEGLIKFNVEKSAGYWGDEIKIHKFLATEKLKNIDLPLNDKEKFAVRSIYREYSTFTPKEIEEYDHAVYRHNKTRTDVESKKYSLQKTKELIAKHKGDEKAALEEWLSE
ncbi:MAG: hypothetical protein Q7S21_01445 [archaeon]|nr:hypothetical protein [archaeon]